MFYYFFEMIANLFVPFDIVKSARVHFWNSCSFFVCIAGIFEGFIGFLVSGAITLVLWYGGKLVYENHQDPSTGITPGVFTGTVKHGYLTLACIKKQHV